MKKYEHWFHYGTFIHEPLKASLLDVFHKLSGLPRDPKELYKELVLHHKGSLEKLNKKKPGVLSNKQMELIFPKNQETDSFTFDITLLAVLIRNCCKLLPPVRGWNDKDPPLTDQSIAANVIRARELRNLFHHTDPKEFDKKILDEKWLEGDAVTSALGYKYDSQALKTAALDPKRLSVVHSLILYLQIEQDAAKKQYHKEMNSLKVAQEEFKKRTESNVNSFKKDAADQKQHASKVEADTKKQLQHAKASIKALTDKLENNEKFMKRLVDTSKHKEHLHQEMLPLHGIH